MRNRDGLICMALGLLLLLGAGGLTAYNMWEDGRAGASAGDRKSVV